ncbi:MAG: hypothetical protein FWG91_11805 [Lachnospiraceae bacterium]|nr:hypothetical protein [Lachnospiraceae bacterium]
MSENPSSWSVAAEIRAEQKAALKDMSRKKKLAYFWEYYKIHTIVTIISCAVLFSILYNMFTNKDYSFYAIIINSYELSGETIADEFSTFALLDNDRTKCFVETDTHLDIDDFSPYEAATVQRIMATVIAGQLDTIIADAHTFTYFSDAEFFEDLRLILSEDELKRYEDRFFYLDQALIDERNNTQNLDDFLEITIKTPAEKIAEIDWRSQPEQMKNPVPVGIFITDSPLIKDAYFDNAFPVLGIVGTSTKIESAVLFAEFLLDFP